MREDRLPDAASQPGRRHGIADDVVVDLMKRPLDLAEARKNMGRLESAFKLLAGNAAEPVPVDRKFAIKPPLPLSRNEMRMIFLIQKVVDAFLENREFLFANVRRGG